MANIKISSRMSTNILFLGDIMAGENHYHYGRGIRSLYENQYDKLIGENVKKILFNEIDIILYNFEYSLVENSYIFNDINNSVYCAKYDSLNILPKSKVKVANIANNHFSEHGFERSKSTITYLKKNNYHVIGENNNPHKLSINDNNLYFWGVSLINDKNYNGTYFKSSYSSLLSQINLPKIKNDKDIWILSIHWGTEYLNVPDKIQNVLINKLVDVGFDIIHGHHPHVIQPIGIYKKALLMYSLGNFIFDQNFSLNTRTGLAIKVSINDKIHFKEIYKIKSKKFKIKKIKKLELNNISIKNNSNHKFYISIKKLYYRILMKLEYLVNIHNSNSQTFKYLMKKILIK